MNTYVLSVLAKWFGMLMVSFLSLFGVDNKLSNDKIEVDNYFGHSLSVVNTVVPYDTKYVYNSGVPSNITKIIKEGSDGVIYTSAEGVTEVLRPMESKEILQGTGPQGLYYGIMTGYGPDCVGCSPRGYVACTTEDKQKFSLIDDGLYYSDDEYGSVRIVAAALSKFPCGTILYVENSNFEPFYAVVLDTGSGMRNSLSNGVVHFDLAFNSERDLEVNKATDFSGNVQYNVLRWGF